MEIKNIVIENYGGIKSLKLPDLKFLALVGPNGSGKSTTIDAIRFLLTGKTRYGVYKGQREGSVSASIVGVPLECKITDNGTTTVFMSGKKTTRKSVNEFLQKEGANETALNIATSSEVLEAMKANELSDFFIRNNYLPVQLTAEEVEVFLLGEGCSEAAVSELMKELPDGKFPISELQKVYECFFEKRREYKRLLKPLPDLEKPTGEPEEIRTAVEELLKKQGAQATAKAAMEAYQAALRNTQLYTKKMTELAEEIARIPYKGEDLSTEINKIKNEIEEARKLGETLNLQVHQHAENYKSIAEMLKKLQSDSCPLDCSIKCSTDKSCIIKKFNQNLEDTKKAGAAAKAERNKVYIKVDELTKKLQELEANQKMFEQRSTLQKQMETMPKPAKVIKPEFEEDKTDYTSVITSLKRQLAAHDEYAVWIKESENQKTYKKIVNLSDELVKVLGTKSALMSRIIEVGIADLQAVAQEQALKIKSDLKLQFTANEGLQVSVVPKFGGEEMPIHNLSTGERAITLMLLLDLINQVSGMGIMIIDDLEKLDPGNLGAVVKFLENDTDSNFIVIACVAHKNITDVLPKKSIVKL